MKRKSVFNYLLVFIFVFSFALAFQIAATDQPLGGPDCCYKPCDGVGPGDWGHLEGNPKVGEQICTCEYDPEFYMCVHECNQCAQY